MKTTADATWKDVVRAALEHLGGQGHLSDINRIVKNHPKTRTNPTWKDTIRRVVRQYTIFEPVPPNRSGLYRLVEQPRVDAEPENLTTESPVDHGIAQGMLLTLGRLYGYETFAPASDRTARSFQGKPRYGVKLFVVAPGEDERSRFDGLIKLNKFRKFRERMRFRDYGELDTLYNSAVKHEENSKMFGVEAR